MEQNIKTKKKRAAPRRITDSYLHNAGIYYLRRFTASTGHFRTVMVRKIERSCAVHKDQDKQDCLTRLEELVRKFQDAGLLDDTAYAQGMVRSLRRRGASRQMICARLSAKGLDRILIDAALAAHADEDENNRDAERNAAMELARRRKIGPYAQNRAPDEKTCKKWLSLMARAGFSYETARQVLVVDDDR